MLDICTKCDKDDKIEYVWFDTGLEYQATKDHLKYLEEKYGIEIKPYKAIKPIPLTCKQYGQPFLSKQVSEFMQRLQKHNFKWEDKSFDELVKEYPKGNGFVQGIFVPYGITIGDEADGVRNGGFGSTGV